MQVRYTTDAGVARCGSLELKMDDRQEEEEAERASGTGGSSTAAAEQSVVELRACFGADELRLCAVNTTTGHTARTTVPFACQ